MKHNNPYGSRNMSLSIIYAQRSALTAIPATWSIAHSFPLSHDLSAAFLMSQILEEPLPVRERGCVGPQNDLSLVPETTRRT